MNEESPRRDELEPADHIAVAIEAEKKTAWFYRMMAEMTSDRETRKTLGQLADDESAHADTLLHLYFEITGHGIIDPPSATAEGQPDLFDFPSATPRAAFDFALQNEIKAAEQYRLQADACEDPRHAKIFRQLAEMELEHAAYLRLKLSRIDAE